MTNSDDDARKIQATLEKIPEVLEVRSLESFVPEDQPAKLKLIAEGAKVLNPALNPDSIDAAPSDAENVDALKSTVENLRKTAGDAKGPGAVASRRLADALAKLGGVQSGHARQGPGHLCRAAEDRARSAQEPAAGPAGQLADAAARTREFVEDQGWPAARRGAAARRSQRQRHAAQIRRRGAGRRTERDRRSGIDPEVRRNRRQGLHPRRYVRR